MTRSLSDVPVALLAVVATAAVLLLIDDLLPPGAYFDTDSVAFWLSAGIGATAVAAVGRYYLIGVSWQAAPRIALRIAISVIAIGIAVGAAEVATRWTFRDITTTTDARGFFSRRWNLRAVQFNSHGFREREVVVAKPPGVYRIAVLGDSFTFGNGIDEGDRYSALLQRALRGGFEVINFGMGGNNTPDLVADLCGPVARFRPDFALVQWFVNDVEGNSRKRPEYQPLIPVRRMHETLHASSALYTLIDSWWIRRQVLGLAPGSYAASMQARFGDPHGEEALSDRKAMGELFAAARAQGVSLGLVLFPDTGYDLGDTYPFAFLHERVLALCAEERTTCVDLRPAFAAVKHRESLWANRLDRHPGAHANALAATQILQTFQARWLLAHHSPGGLHQ